MISWPYLAGFFDGEGSICFSGRNTCIQLPQAGPQGELILVEIQRFLDGYKIQSNLYYRLKSSPLSKLEDHRLFIQKKHDAKKFLSNILPYLNIKRVKALDSIRFLTLYSR